MKQITYTILTLVIFFASATLFSQGVKSQEIINDALNKESIKNQFEVLITKSNDFQSFKNIKHSNLNKFKRNFLDSLKAFDRRYNIAESKINNQKLEIEKLQSQVSTINNNLTAVTEEKNSIGLFGIRMTKATYNTILWSIISGLLAATLFLSYKFKTSNTATKFAQKSFTEVESEFEDHKKKSLEREQILRRKLQDEINKQRS